MTRHQSPPPYQYDASRVHTGVLISRHSGCIRCAIRTLFRAVFKSRQVDDLGGHIVLVPAELVSTRPHFLHCSAYISRLPSGTTWYAAKGISGPKKRT